MLQPKRTKFRKAHSRSRGCEQRGSVGHRAVATK